MASQSHKGIQWPSHDITAAEWASMIRCCNRRLTGARDRTMLTLAYRHGLRSLELCTLRLTDVRLEAGEYGLLTVLGKGGKQRELALDKHSSPAVQTWIEIRRSDSDWLFPTSQGEKLDTSYLRRLVKRLATAANITKRVHMHAARHSFADAFYAETKNPKIVQLALGHVSLATTDAYLSERQAKQSMLVAMAKRD